MDHSLSSDDLVDLGESHHRAGRLNEAESHYCKALEIDPGHPGALYFLANIAYEDNRLPFAEELVAQLLKDDATDIEAWHLRGVIAAKENKLEKAVECFNQALACEPNYAQAHCSKGDALARFGQADAAITCFESALVQNPRSGDIVFRIANTQQSCGQLQRAIANYRKAIALNYVSALLYVNFANALSSINQREEAKICLEQALALDPQCTDAYRNLGNLFVEVGEIERGTEILEKSIAIKPDVVSLRTNLALVLFCTGRLNDAIATLNAAIAIEPNNAEAHSILLGLKQYTPGYSREMLYRDHAAFGERFEPDLKAHWIRRTHTENPAKRLRVGFVSADLYAHPVGYFFEAVLRELCASNQLDIVVYAMNAAQDAVTERLRAMAGTWIAAAGWSDEALDQKIRADKIDILVDMAGHTVPNRLLVFARKPAPIQISWLGYWETTGLRAMDYILCDAHGVHSNDDKYFVEKPWRLPNTRLCFTLPTDAVAVAQLPALHNHYVTFGCFNNLVKMTDQVVAVWAEILKRVPNSRLLLKSVSFVDSNIRNSVIARFNAHAIAAERLLLEISSPRSEYFSAYGRMDIALDPFPFPGGTTTVEGLWMGVPVITLQGDRIISRQGESILNNLGLSDWIATDMDDYVERAVRKAADISALSELRNTLRTRLELSPLCDAKLFSQNLIDAFQSMWRHYCAAENGEQRIG